MQPHGPAPLRHYALSTLSLSYIPHKEKCGKKESNTSVVENHFPTGCSNASMGGRGYGVAFHCTMPLSSGNSRQFLINHPQSAEDRWKTISPLASVRHPFTYIGIKILKISMQSNVKAHAKFPRVIQQVKVFAGDHTRLL